MTAQGLLLKQFPTSLRLQGIVISVHALRAELIRTAIDFVNHVVLYIANKISFDQYYSIKKYIVFVPSFLFTAVGIETMGNLWHEVFHGLGNGEESFAIIPLVVSLPGLHPEYYNRNSHYIQKYQ
jgi:hypothetical protein